MSLHMIQIKFTKQFGGGISYYADNWAECRINWTYVGVMFGFAACVGNSGAALVAFLSSSLAGGVIVLLLGLLMIGLRNLVWSRCPQPRGRAAPDAPG